MILPGEIEEEKLTGNELNRYRKKMKILKLLYTQGALSGSELSRQLSVSLPTALAFLKELTEMGLVEVKGTGTSRGGRRPVLFRLRKDSNYVIACEIGRYQAKIGIFNPNNQQIGSFTFFNTDIDDEALAGKIYEHGCALAEANGIAQDHIFAVGVCMPGLVDSEKGINYTIKNKEFRNLKERLEEKFSRLVYINNDARMQAYGEYVFGAARDAVNALVVNWSWGIGLGTIINGKLYNGSKGFASELSHIQVEEEGDLCICGKRGCLETVTSSYVLLREAIKGIEQETISQLTGKFRGRTGELKPEDVIFAARGGDEFSIHLLHKLGLAMGKGLSITIQLFNPEIIVLGGPLSAARQFVLTPIQQSLNKFCLPELVAHTAIEISEHWEKAGVLGLTATLFQMIFGDVKVFTC